MTAGEEPAPAIGLRSAFLLTLGFVGLLWLVWFLGSITGVPAGQWGVYPRELMGLPGILTAPLVHTSWSHLASNTPPILLLGTLLLLGYPRSAIPALLIIWLLSGLGVWLFARSSFHLGASGLTHGIFFYLFVAGILRRDRRSAVLLLIAFYLYGGMVLTIFPTEPDISFESHFFGALAGGFAAWLLRRFDPRPPRKRYSWEFEDEEAEEDDTDPGDRTESVDETGPHNPFRRR